MCLSKGPASAVCRLSPSSQAVLSCPLALLGPPCTCCPCRGWQLLPFPPPSLALAFSQTPSCSYSVSLSLCSSPPPQPGSFCFSLGFCLRLQPAALLRAFSKRAMEPPARGALRYCRLLGALGLSGCSGLAQAHLREGRNGRKWWEQIHMSLSLQSKAAMNARLRHARWVLGPCARCPGSLSPRH